MKQMKNSKEKGFTLIELLVVISVIALLSSITLTTINSGSIRARDAARVENLTALRNALELYHSDFGVYPLTFVWDESSDPDKIVVPKLTTCGDPTNFIPGLAPKYIAKLPTDPNLVCGGRTHGYSYASDGLDYKLITHSEGAYNSTIFIDPAWDGGDSDIEGYCTLDGEEHYHYGVWTDGAKCWRI